MKVTMVHVTEWAAGIPETGSLLTHGSAHENNLPLGCPSEACYPREKRCVMDGAVLSLLAGSPRVHGSLREEERGAAAGITHPTVLRKRSLLNFPSLAGGKAESGHSCSYDFQLFSQSFRTWPPQF